MPAHVTPQIARPPCRRKRPLSRTMLQQCDTLAFTWSTKLGVLVGVSTGGGFLLKKAPGGGWSAPLFVTVKEVKAGVLVGVSKVSFSSLHLFLCVACSMRAVFLGVVGSQLCMERGGGRGWDRLLLQPSRQSSWDHPPNANSSTLHICSHRRWPLCWWRGRGPWRSGWRRAAGQCWAWTWRCRRGPSWAG